MDKNFKLVLFDIGLLLTSVVFSLTLGRAFAGANLDLVGSLAGINTFLLIGAAFVFLGLMASVVSFFSPDFNRLALSFCVSGLAFFVALTGIGNIVVRLGLAVIFVAALFIFAAFVRSETQKILKFSVHKVFFPSLRTLGILLTILFCTGFFFSYRSQVEQEGFKAPAALIDKVVEITGRSVLEVVTREIASTSKLPDQGAVLEEIPEELREAGLIETLEEEFGIKIDRVPQSSADLMQMIRPALRDKISQQIEDFLAPYTPFIPTLVSLSIFLSLLPLATIGAFLIIPGLALTFKVLEALKIIVEKTETVAVQRLVLN
jgi:hypothetical protein